MSPRTEARLEKVKRMSHSGRRVCLLLMALLSLAGTVEVFGTLAMPETQTCEVGGLRQPCSELPPEVVTLTVVGMVGAVALILTALYRLARLFRNYARGEIFTRASVREIRFLGYLAVAFAVFQIVFFVAALVLVAGVRRAEWPADLQFEFPIGTLVMAMFVLLLAWIMDIGAEMREENELTV
jgi:di/tricarboxylate transporter